MLLQRKTYPLIIPVIISVACCSLLKSQPANWAVNNGSKINWYQNTRYGIILIGTNKCLMAVDPTIKKIIWEMPAFGEYGQSAFHIREQLPIFIVYKQDTTKPEGEKKGLGGFLKKAGLSIVAPKLVTKEERHQREQWFSYLTGEMVFDTEDAGIKRLTNVDYFLQAGSAILRGYNGDEFVTACLSLSSRKKLWQFSRPGTLIKPILGIGSKKGLDVSFSKISADVNGNYIFDYIDSLYCLQGVSGENVWKKQKPFTSVYSISKVAPYLFGYIGDTLIRVNTSTGVIDKSIALPELLSKGKDKNADLFALVNPNRISVADTIVETENDKGFVLFGQAFEHFVNKKTYPLNVEHSYAFASMMALPDGNRALVFKSKEKELIAVIRFSSNYTCNWTKPTEVYGKNLRAVFSHPDAFVTVTDKGFGILNPVDGSLKWPDKTFASLDSAFLFAENPAGTHLCIFNSGKLYQLEYKTMQVSEILAKTDFKGGDPEDKEPVVLEGLEDGWLLGAGQNMLLIDYATKKPVYNLYIDKPGMSQHTSRLISGIGGILTGYALKNEASKLTDVYYKTGQIDAETYIDVKIYDYGAGGTGSALIAGDFAQKIFSSGSGNLSRFRTAGSDYQLMLGKKDGKPCVLQIDKKTGATKQVIPMSDKKQVMETDVVNQGMFTVNEDNKTFEYYPLK